MTKTRIKVYIAGPYSSPDTCYNTNRAIHVGQELWELGYTPYIPHLSHLWHTVIPKNNYEMWMLYGLEFLKCCNALLRLSGESPGADREVKIAGEMGIPVFSSVGQLIEKMPPK